MGRHHPDRIANLATVRGPERTPEGRDSVFGYGFDNERGRVRSSECTIEPGRAVDDVNAEFAINRKDFGVVYPGMPDDLIKDDILIKLQVRSKNAS